jgi:hypothetical protein
MGALKNNNIFTFINTTYDISLDSQISLLPLGFSLHILALNSMVRANKRYTTEDPITKNIPP